MLKTHMAACLVASALINVPALAQTSPAAPATNVAPVTTPAGPAGTTMGANPNATTGANTGTSTTAGSATIAGGNFVTRREPGMYKASELIGKDVRGGNNEDIGEVGDLLIDPNGQVRAVILDIGGFLGIGETNVAIPMQQVQLRPNQQNAATTGTTGNTTATTGSTATTGAAGQSTTAQTGTNQNSSNMGAGTGTTGPDVIVVLMMTKDQLQNAPKFEDNTR